MAVSPSPNDLTRQQLDELDVLLQRMLALPLNQPEPAVAFPPPPPLPDLPPPRPVPRTPAEPPPPASWRADTPAVAKTPHLLPAPEPATPFTPAFQPFPPGPADNPSVRLFAPPDDPAPVVAPGTLRGVDAPALPFDYQPAEPPARHPDPTPVVDFPDVNPFADPPAVVAPAPTPSAAGDPVPVPLWPLFGLNWVLEFALGWFGPVGQLLTRPANKTLLGWAGVLLLLGAGVWAARGLGWIPWPR